jgi:hypothetical protein
MQPRFGIATALCFATLLAGCVCGSPKREDGALGNRASVAGAGALVAQETGRVQHISAGQSEQIDRVKRAAAFRDYGRYYK